MSSSRLRRIMLTALVVAVGASVGCASGFQTEYGPGELEGLTAETVYDFLYSHPKVRLVPDGHGGRAFALENRDTFAAIYVDDQLQGEFLSSDLDKHGVRETYLPATGVLRDLPLHRVQRISIRPWSKEGRELGYEGMGMSGGIVIETSKSASSPDISHARTGPLAR